MQTSVEIKTKKNTRKVPVDLSKNAMTQKKIISPLTQKLNVKEKTQFQKDCEGAITIEEAQKRSLAFIDRIWKK
jgi:hypothetical protein